MPTYCYVCHDNGQTHEVFHGMTRELHSWRELCELANMPVGETNPEAPVERILYPPNVSVPLDNAKLKSLGFTKLVRRDKGVYENVTAGDSQNRFVVNEE